MKIKHQSDYRSRRASAYPSVGDQLGAITDALAAMRANDTALPQSTIEILDAIAAIKATLPKSTGR